MNSNVQKMIDLIKSYYPKDQKVVDLFENGIKNTLETTLKKQEDGTVFVITGDIPAMWLRDSSAQVRPLLMLASQDEEIKGLIRGVIERQKTQIIDNPYANAFNLVEHQGHHDDLTLMTPLTWEAKFEVDSLCYPIQLAYLYYQATKDDSIFDLKFYRVARTIFDTFRTEQHHESKSHYRFIRTNPEIMKDIDRIPYETLQREGKGTLTAYTGMIWSGFRPSDDACQFGYLIPANMFAVVILGYLTELMTDIYQDLSFASDLARLKDEVQSGIENFGIVDHQTYGQVYAYEVDGLGNYLLMDDANVPSLLSAPYLGYLKKDDLLYLNTRKLLLSKDNPFYYEGLVAKGIGSPHTPPNHIWHIALAIEGMTSSSDEDCLRILELFKTTDAHTNLMHEGFHVDDPSLFSRPWFSWANSMFAEFLLMIHGHHIPSSPLK